MDPSGFLVHCQGDGPSLVPGHAHSWQNSALTCGSNSLSGGGELRVKRMSGDVSLDTECSETDSVCGDTVTEPVSSGSQDQPGTVERKTLSSIPEVRRSQSTVQNVWLKKSIG